MLFQIGRGEKNLFSAFPIQWLVELQMYFLGPD